MIEIAEQKPKVLVIDDEVVNITVLSGILSGHGLEVVTARDGPAGRAAAREHRPDIILLDIMMPGENGFETCRQLLHDPETTDIPVIFVSALADVESKVRGLEIGAVDYVTKPFEEAEVLARIRLHLKLKLSRRAVIEEQAAKLRQITEAQQALLVSPREVPEARFAVRYIPILEAGGDFYDVFSCGKRSYTYFVSDISGHDLGASFATSSLKALVRQNFCPLYTLLEGMKVINDVLSAVLPDGRYLTAQGCSLNRAKRELTVVSAGHPPPVFVPGDGVPEFLDTQGDVLGAFDSVLLEPLVRRVDKGDRLFLYTDGLLERIQGRRQTLFQGCDALLQACKSSKGLPLDQAVDRVIQEMQDQAGAWEDDVVLMGVEV